MKEPRKKDPGTETENEGSASTVPSTLEEIKDNISTNNSSQLSKVEIINQAFKFHSEGNMLEAAKYYQYFINQGFKDQTVFSNYGVVLKGLGKLKEAELFQRKAIEINPNFAQAHCNLGNILRDLGKLNEAELAQRKAIELNPDFANAHSNLGNILRDLGKLNEAELSQRKAIELNPNFAQAHCNLGNILRDLGKLDQAEISVLKAIEINPNLEDAKLTLTFLNENKVPKWHIPMMNDYERNNAYLKAIKSAVKNNDYVLEIGTGSGLLSMMAIDSGAKKVVTCEISPTIAKAAKKITKDNGFENRIEVINKKSTDLNIIEDLEKKADLIISEILSSEFVGEGVQKSLCDASKRLMQDNGRMIPEAGEIKIALLESSPEIEEEIFVQRVNGYDLSEFNNIMGKRFSLHYLGRKTKPSFLSQPQVPFSFDFYSQKIRTQEEKILKIEASKSGLCLGLISWLKLNLYENIDFENKPNVKCTSGWVHPIYKFKQPLEISKGQVVKVKASLREDSVWYEFI